VILWDVEPKRRDKVTHMQTNTRGVKETLLAAAALIAIGNMAGMTKQTGGETFTATASVKSPTATVSMPVTIRIDRFVTDAERAKIVAVVKAGDDAATTRALEAAPEIGSVTVGERQTPIKYAYARPAGDGRLITVVTAKPVLFLGAGDPNAKPKKGFDLAVALLVLDAKNAGDGEFAPASRIKTDAAGAVVTEDYSTEMIRLTAIKKVK
jgi:hypothetical protein